MGRPRHTPSRSAPATRGRPGRLAVPAAGAVAATLALLPALASPATATTSASASASAGTLVSHAAAVRVSTTAAGWISTADALQRVAPLAVASPTASPAGAAAVVVDAGHTMQSVDGFGAALTDSAADLLMALPARQRTAALHTLFDPVTGAGIDLVRLPLGATDFSAGQYTYDDVPAGRTDPSLAHLDLTPLDAAVVPILQQALAINPRLRVLATPWSAPAWMKTGGSLVGGSLLPADTDVYAQYLTDVVGGLRQRGIPVEDLTLQNEPEVAPSDYPGMTLTADQEDSLALTLAPRLRSAGFGDVALIGYDHNWDDTAYAQTLLTKQAARAVLAGTAWHCYAGTPSAQTTVHRARPSEGIWETECSGGTWSTDFGSNLGWNAATLAIGAMRDWSRSVLLWNLALDPSGGPHEGGCGTCRGVLTIDPADGTVTPNVEWDVLALAGRSVQPGAHRVDSTSTDGGVETVAYVNPDGTRALTAFNNSGATTTIAVRDGRRLLSAVLPAGSMAELSW